MRANTAQTVLEALHVRKSFGGVRALRGVSLELIGGETHALVGENGAGKSTLIKIITGALQPDAGEIRMHGKVVEHHSPAHARALGIAAIYQQPALFPDLTVAENIGLAKGGNGRWRKVNWTERRAHAAKVLEKVGARIRPDTLARNLSMPEQQLVEIAKAVDANASVLILDEPTASLGEEDVEHLFRIMAEMRTRGTAIIYISHRFEELFRVADRVSVLRDGSSIGTYDMAGITSEKLIHLMVGRELETVFPKHDATLGDAVLDVRRLSSKQCGVKDVSLQVRRGEVLGLAGLVGSGRTQFAEALFGLAPKDEGEVYINGKRVEIESPGDAVREGLAYLPEDRRNHGVVLDMPVAANITIASLQRVSANGFIRFEDEEKTAKDYIRSLTVKTPDSHTPVANLSGGNQQKVALARWLMTDPKILVLDEPTQGIDVGAKAEIYHLIGRLAQKGTAVLMISSEMNEILGMSDRIAVMAKGKIAGVLSREEATPYKILELTLGLGSSSGQEGAQ
ncbi:MAG: sugar ABC transporter ATP-binding protein [Acidobacteriaceae bacterium]|nr:sugar ABC transporter ATP-binding protein [Acidobacteriaceae bacterium]